MIKLLYMAAIIRSTLNAITVEIAVDARTIYNGHLNSLSVECVIILHETVDTLANTLTVGIWTTG